MTSLLVKRDGAWVPQLGGRTRGPDGTRKPEFTPDYDTPADTTTNAAGLQTAITNAASGDVIELTSNLTGVVTLTSPAGASSWTENVLIRPPLGQRLTSEVLKVTGQKLTVAGLDFVSQVGVGVDAQGYGAYKATVAVTGHRSALWRCVDDSAKLEWTVGSSSSADGVKDMALVECAAPYPWIHATTDRTRMSSTNLINQYRTLYHGCYFGPAWLGVAPGSKEVPLGLITETNVTTGTGKTGFTAVNGSWLTAPYPVNCIVGWLESPAVSAVTVVVKKNGAQVASFTLDGVDSVNPRARTIYAGSGLTAFTVAASDVITYDVSGDPGSGNTLHIDIGRYAGGSTSLGAVIDFHVDALQWFASGGGAPHHDTIIIDNVFGGNNSSKTLQSANMAGELVVVNNWLGNAPEIAEFGQAPGGSLANLRQYVAYNHLEGTAKVGDSGLLKLFKHNEATGYNVPSGAGLFAYDASNTVVAREGVPDCPDLAAVWPECPYTVRDEVHVTDVANL